MNTGWSLVPTIPDVCIRGHLWYTPGPLIFGRCALMTPGCQGPALKFGMSVGLYILPLSPTGALVALAFFGLRFLAMLFSDLRIYPAGRQFIRTVSPGC